MKKTSTFKILFLLRLLLEKDRVKNEIVEEFQKADIFINKPTINRYINILKENGIEIELSKIKNQTLYKLSKKDLKFYFSKSELKCLKALKKGLFSFKNFTLIRHTMRLFYKIALLIDDNEIKEELIDFDYFSILNPAIAFELEKHCKNKNIIEIEYILKDKKKKDLILQAESLSIGKYSNRTYLNCILENTSKLSHLPLDKIFVIKRVLKDSDPLILKQKTITYSLLKDCENEFETDKNEKVVFEDDKKIKIETVVEDEFSLIQKLLSHCPFVCEISDEKIKEKVLLKLKEVRAKYA